MAPLKFEEKMKEKLDQRVIRPSEDSWKRLASKIDDTQIKKNESKNIFWYAIAAIFIGALIMTSIFKSNSITGVDTDTKFVNTDDKNVQQENTEVVQKEVLNEEILNNQDEVVTQHKIDTHGIVESTPIHKRVVSKNSIDHSRIIKKEKSSAGNKSSSKDNDLRGLEKNTDVAHTQEQAIKVSPNPVHIIDDEVAKVVAQIQELQKNNTEVTDNEINTLLLEAQREITAKKILKSNTVSASALLQDVEDEIDETFKQRVFEALKTGFQKVKTAVAEREN